MRFEVVGLSTGFSKTLRLINRRSHACCLRLDINTVSVVGTALPYFSSCVISLTRHGMVAKGPLKP